MTLVCSSRIPCGIRLLILGAKTDKIILTLRNGPLAHLVERTHGMGEVTGSSPVRSKMEKKKIFVLVGHPDNDSLSAEFAANYARGAEETGHEVRRVNLGDLSFDPILHKGYKENQPLESDLLRVQEDIRWCDHFVIFYPAWFSTMPALLKGMFDRLWLPGFAFQFYKEGMFKEKLWRALLKGRTARVFVLSDSPPILARLIFGDTTNEIRKGILWFAGIHARVKKIGPVKFITELKVEKWRQRFHRWGRKAW